MLFLYRVSTVSTPHGVEDSAVLHDAKQLVWSGHVMSQGFLRVVEKGVWSPNPVHHAVV